MTPEQSERYSRHINLPQIGLEGQKALLGSHVMLIGLGGLGSPAALYLAASGVGKLTFVDFDVVELSNLQRQIAHTNARIGELKTHSARQACLDLNPDIEINTVDYEMERDELFAMVSQCSVVIEGSDNFPTRFLVNEACVANRVPLVSGAAIRFDGQITVFRNDQQDSPCYRCLYKEGGDTAETCSQTGVLAPFVGMVGTMQAIETIKVITGAGQDLGARLILLDGLNMDWTAVKLVKSTDCPVCSTGTQSSA